MTDYALVRGGVIRVTKTDACGNRVLGPRSVVVTEGVISVGLTARTETGEAISVTNAAGKVCVSDTPAPKFLGYDVAVSFCKVNPELYSNMSGQPVVMDAAGAEAIGFDMNSDVNLDDQGFVLEMWSRVPTDSCGVGGLQSFGYFLLPFLKGGVIGDFSWENAAINFSLTGAQTKDGSPWGVGPYDVELDENGDPGPLNTPISTKNHLRQILTQVPPPAAAEGAFALGVPATTATAGIPATLTPSNSYPPENFASITGLTASPLSAWTTGQYVRLGDGSQAHWNGTAWVTGPRP